MRALILACLAAAAAARKAAPVGAAKAAEEAPARLVVEGRLVTGSALHEVRVVLNDGEHTAIPRQDGSFVFLAVAPGSYLLEVHDVHNVWPMVRVDVSAKSAGKIRAILTHTKEVMALPITLEPVLVKPKWFEVRPPFQVRALTRARGIVPAWPARLATLSLAFAVDVDADEPDGHDDGRHAAAHGGATCSRVPYWGAPFGSGPREGGCSWAQVGRRDACVTGLRRACQVAMPKMMANMDPEQLEEMKQMQSSMGGSWKDMLEPEKLKEKQQALQQKEKGGGKKKSKD